MKNRIGIWCEVSGGITGHRQAWLKSNGAVCEFSSREQAEEEAERLNRTANGPFTRACFCYSVRQIANDRKTPWISDEIVDPSN